MSASFVYRPSEKGWFIDTTSVTTSMEVSAIVGRDIRPDDFPLDVTVVGHVQSGGKWIVILKPAGERELRGLLLEREEYRTFDPFRAAAGLKPVVAELAEAIETRRTVPAPTVASLVPLPGTAQEMFSKAGLPSYLPYAYAAFIEADVAERRQDYWSYLPTKLALSSIPLARFGARGERSLVTSGGLVPPSITPTTVRAAAPPPPLLRDGAHALMTADFDAAAIKTKMRELEQAIERLSSERARQPDIRRYDERFDNIHDDDKEEFDTRTSNLSTRHDTQQDAGKAQLEQVTRAATGTVDGIGRDASTQSEPEAVVSTGTAPEPKQSPRQRIPLAILTVIASAITAALIVVFSKQDISSEIDRATASATRAEAASARIEAMAPEFDVKMEQAQAAAANAAKAREEAVAAGGGAVGQIVAKENEVTEAIMNAANNAKESITTAEATAAKAIGAAEKNAKAVIEEASNNARRGVEGTQETAVESLTKARAAMLACLPLLAKAQVDLATARKQSQQNSVKQLETAVKNAEAKCVPNP